MTASLTPPWRTRDDPRFRASPADGAGAADPLRQGGRAAPWEEDGGAARMADADRPPPLPTRSPVRALPAAAAADAADGSAGLPADADRPPPLPTRSPVRALPAAAADAADGSAGLPADAADGSAGLPDDLRAIWRAGGWDGRLPPESTWLRVHGDRAFPGAEAWARMPTFGPADRLLDDPGITDIHLNGPGIETTIRRSGDAIEVGIGETWHPAWLDWLATQCVRRAGVDGAAGMPVEGTADATRPGRPPCRVRFVIVPPPLCPHGPAITMRVLRPGALTLETLTAREMLTPAAAELLACCVRAHLDVLLVGLPGVGKTTLAQALIGAVADQRLIVLEDVPELALPPARVVRMTTGPDAADLYHRLLRLALRMNPQRIVIGEVRGSEAYAALAAASNGFPVLTTVHGDHAMHGVQTLAVKAAQAQEARGGLETVYAMINARPSIVVGLAQRDGRRTVDEIIELQRQFGAQRPVGETLYARMDGTLRRLAYPSAAVRARLEAAGAWPTLEEDV
jgi:pilus assembly protein CpaF